MLFTKTLNPKYFSFIITNVKEKQQILTSKKQEPTNVWQFCLEMTLTD